MATTSLTVLGAGNTGFAVAANLTLAGARVTLGETPSFRHMVEPILQSRRIALDGVAGTGNPQLHHVTTDLAEALAENELVLLIVPSYGHQAFAEQCAPHLRSGQVIVLMPGNLGALEFARIARDAGAEPGVAFAETDTAPYVCRKMSPTSAHIWGIVQALGVGVFPATEGERVRDLLEPLFPGTHLYPHVLACGLSAMNPVVHPAGILLNAGRVERARGEFYFYDEGVTPGVCRLIEAIDAERLAVGKSLGVELTPVAEAFHLAGFGPQGDLWATINGSRMLTALRAPGALETRWLTEDVPYGLATWSLLGAQFDVDCPLMRSVVDLTSSMLGIDFRKSTRTPDRLGIAGFDKEKLLDYVAGAPQPR